MSGMILAWHVKFCLNKKFKFKKNYKFKKNHKMTYDMI